MTLWIGYAKTGKEFEVTASLDEIGITAHCAQKVEAIRRGKQRRPEIITTPVLPNYVMIETDNDDGYYAIAGVKHLHGNLHRVPRGDERGVRAFLSCCDIDYQDWMRRIEAGERVSEYQVDQAIKIISGPMRDMLATFRATVETGGAYPKIQAEVMMMGRAVSALFDPLDVRADD